MKKFVKIAGSILGLLLFIISLDLFFCRGYFSDFYLSPFYVDYTERREVDSEDLEFVINKEKDLYHITLKNKSIKLFFTRVYREGILFSRADTIIPYYYRTKSFYPKSKDDYDNSFGCGTGLGHISINPLEHFNKKLDYVSLVKNYVYFNYLNRDNDTINDLIYNKPHLILKENKPPTVLKRNDLIEIDSINFKLYLPVYNYNYSKMIYVKSNTFKVAYLDIITNYIDQKKKDLELFQNF
jgi:hypothetical protein